MDGRFFDGRRVSASFYPADAFLAGVFGLQGTEAVAPRSKTITMEEIAAMHAETKPSDAEASSTDLPTANGDGGGGGGGAEHEQAGSDDDFMRQLRARAEEAQRREAKRSQELLEARDDAIDALVEEFPDAADGAAGGGDDDADADPSADRAAAAASKKVLPTVDHSKIDYAPFRKSFYVEAPEIAAMTDEEVAALRKEMDDVKVRGKRCPRPVKRWRQCGLSDRILAAIEKAGYDKPFPIQAQSLPAVMSGRDVIAIAKTGSGKTMGYTLPMVRHAMDQPRLAAGEGPIGLVMVPTRELALQVYREVKKFASVTGLGVAAVYGGTNQKEVIAELKRGAELVVCTPGRMIDMLTANSGRVTNLRRVTYVVLDEADRMFDMGFAPQIDKISRARGRPADAPLLGAFPRRSRSSRARC